MCDDFRRKGFLLQSRRSRAASAALFFAQLTHVTAQGIELILDTLINQLIELIDGHLSIAGSESHRPCTFVSV